MFPYHRPEKASRNDWMFGDKSLSCDGEAFPLRPSSITRHSFLPAFPCHYVYARMYVWACVSQIFAFCLFPLPQKRRDNEMKMAIEFDFICLSLPSHLRHEIIARCFLLSPSTRPFVVNRSLREQLLWFTFCLSLRARRTNFFSRFFSDVITIYELWFY